MNAIGDALAPDGRQEGRNDGPHHVRYDDRWATLSGHGGALPPRGVRVDSRARRRPLIRSASKQVDARETPRPCVRASSAVGISSTCGDDDRRAGVTHRYRGSLRHHVRHSSPRAPGRELMASAHSRGGCSCECARERFTDLVFFNCCRASADTSRASGRPRVCSTASAPGSGRSPSARARRGCDRAGC